MKLRTTKCLITIFLVFVSLGVNAQQTKRNLLMNSDFEEGFRNWRIDNILDDDGNILSEFSIEETNPIAGTQSAKIEVNKHAVDGFNVQLYTFFPIEENAKYKVQFKARASQQAMFAFEVCETHQNHTHFKPLDYESGSLFNHEVSNTGFDSWHPNDLRGWVHVGEEVTEYEIITQGNQFGYPNYSMSFMFGHATPGAIFWIDDIKISRCDDGDWDGNLFSTGNFESDRIVFENSQGYYIDGRTDNPESVARITDNPEEVISGNKTLYIHKAVGENHWDFWTLSYHANLLWQNEGTNIEVSLKAKASKPNNLMLRTNANDMMGTAHWWHGGGGVDWVVPLTTEVQTFYLDESMATFWRGKDDGVAYDEMIPMNFDWDPIVRFGYRGRISVFGSFNDHDMVADDCSFWIDDIVVKESNLFLEDFDVEYAPAEVVKGQTAQFKIGDFVKPTHAPTAVEFWVENDTGEASIDQDGVLTGEKAGMVKVFVADPNELEVKEFEVEVTPITGNNNLNAEVIRLSSTMVNSSELIEVKSPVAISFDVYDITGSMISSHKTNDRYIRTDGLAAGTYLVKVVAENNLTTVRKFIVR